MVRKRPCGICRKWLQPHPRAGDRQRVCSSPECQRERHRRADRAWHQRHPDYDRDRRLRVRLQAEEVRPGCLLPGLDWVTVQDAVGLEVRVVIEESSRLLLRVAQDAVGLEPLEIPGESRRVPPTGLQDETARRGPAP